MSKTSIQFGHPWRPIESGMKQPQIEPGVVAGFNTDHILSIMGDANAKAIKITFSTEIRPTTLLLDKEDRLTEEQIADAWNAARDMIADKMGVSIERILIEVHPQKGESPAPAGEAGLVAGGASSKTTEEVSESAGGQEGAPEGVSEEATAGSDRADDPIVALEEPLRGE